MSGLERRARVRAAAKINLDLRVLGKRPDGFHERQVDRWLAFLDSYKVRDLPGLDDAADWLRRNRPRSISVHAGRSGKAVESKSIKRWDCLTTNHAKWHGKLVVVYGLTGARSIAPPKPI